ncbi:MAG: tRNA preQ1(34) S-adenosylmethionine ribosyltransferase-isomerase QueA [Clostridiaceae bacterium]|nr:tRNA preQ1(34) S-adenosylmethionine ribosyltransferase-isomerase QueA [Clostridiaceae bacterium]
MQTKDFYYDLPPEQIAQVPLPQRDQSRLLYLSPDHRAYADYRFRDLPQLLLPGDCLVMNDTRVLPARLLGHKADTGIAVECLLLERRDLRQWECLVKPGRRLRPGARIVFASGELTGDIVDILPEGHRLIEFIYEGVFEALLAEIGHVPLPPYIHTELSDEERYQTVYASVEGSTAAPTAGLHFTTQLLNEIRADGIDIVNLTLHVGTGTFRPVSTERIEEHTMHSEYFSLTTSAAERINAARARGGRVIACGTTSARVLESVCDADGCVRAEEGRTDIFIYPGYEIRAFDALITNFHLPQSTLLMLVAALAGRQTILAAYRHAVASGYRFFSFGDAMFIERARDPAVLSYNGPVELRPLAGQSGFPRIPEEGNDE